MACRLYHAGRTVTETNWFRWEQFAISIEIFCRSFACGRKRRKEIKAKLKTVVFVGKVCRMKISLLSALFLCLHNSSRSSCFRKKFSFSFFFFSSMLSIDTRGRKFKSEKRWKYASWSVIQQHSKDERNKVRKIPETMSISLERLS